jgi:uncharacterized membrane protein YjfL (UPF0719 family)
MFASVVLAELIGTIVYTFVGVGLMGLFWWMITRFSPFPVVREIEHDQNVALAVLIGAVFIALSIIIAAVILS